MEEAFDMYRQSVIGVALIEMLDKMVASGMHSPELAMVVVVQFDKVAPSLPFHMLPLHCFLSQTHRSTTSIYLGGVLILVIVVVVVSVHLPCAGQACRLIIK